MIGTPTQFLSLSSQFLIQSMVLLVSLYDLTVLFSTIPLTSYLTSNKCLLHIHTHIYIKTKPFTNSTDSRRKKQGGEKILSASFHLIVYLQINRSFSISQGRKTGIIISGCIVFDVTFHYYNELHTNKIFIVIPQKSLANWF